MGRTKKSDKEPLSKYELSRIIGARALQLELGAPPLVKVPDKTINPIEVSKLEFAQNAIPLHVLK